MSREFSSAPAASLVRAFLSWWFRELEAFFGSRGQRRRSLRPSWLLFYHQGQFRLLDMQKGVPKEVGTFPLDRPRCEAFEVPASGATRYPKELPARYKSREVLLRVAVDYGVIARDVVPKAQERDLREIVGHRLDVLTPWSSDQALFDCAVLAVLPDGRCEVAIAAVPKPLVDDLRDRCEALGFTVGAIDIGALDEPVPSRFVVWEADTHHRRRLPVTLAALAGGGLALAVLWAAFEIHSRSIVLREGERTTAALAAQLADLPELKRQLEALRGELGLVAGRLKAAPSALRIVEELSRILPDEVFLERLELDRERLLISGYAPSASVLVPLLEASAALEDVRFEAPSIVTLVNGASGKRELERFVLSARVERTARGGS